MTSQSSITAIDSTISSETNVSTVDSTLSRENIEKNFMSKVRLVS